MTRMAEQEIRDTLKKSEFRGMVATVISTATIMASLFFGGIKIIDAVKSSISVEVKAQIDKEISEYSKRQALKDLEQDAKIEQAMSGMGIKTK